MRWNRWSKTNCAMTVTNRSETCRPVSIQTEGSSMSLAIVCFLKEGCSTGHGRSCCWALRKSAKLYHAQVQDIQTRWFVNEKRSLPVCLPLASGRFQPLGHRSTGLTVRFNPGSGSWISVVWLGGIPGGTFGSTGRAPDIWANRLAGNEISNSRSFNHILRWHEEE